MILWAQSPGVRYASVVALLFSNSFSKELKGSIGWVDAIRIA